MAYATLGGVPILDARVSLPRVGAWTAELRVDAEEPPAGQQLLVIGDVPFVGAVTRGVGYRANAFVRMVGGVGGLPSQLAAKGYHSSPVMVPLQDIARETGETLAPTCDASVTNVLLGHWARLEGSGGSALGRLLSDVPGAVWRFLPGGQLWVGAESWPAIAPEVEITDYQPLEDCIRLFSHSPSVLPGQLFLGRKTSYVEHRVSEARVSTAVWFEAQA